MDKSDQKSPVTFAEVPRPAGSSYTQHSSPAFNGKFMVSCQGMKLFIPEDFQTETLLKILRAMKQLW